MSFAELCHSCQWSKKYSAGPLAVACHQSYIMVWLSADGMSKKQVYNITFILLTRRYFLFLSVHSQMFACPDFYRNYRKSCSSLMSGFVLSKPVQNMCLHIFVCIYADSSFLRFFSGSWFEESGCRSRSNNLSPIPSTLPAKNKSGIWITIIHSWFGGFKACEGALEIHMMFLSFMDFEWW